MFEIFPPIAKYTASPSPILFPTPTILADEVQGVKMLSNSCVPPSYLKTKRSVSLSLPIRSNLISRFAPPHTQTKNLLVKHVFVWGGKTVSVTDDTSTSDIRFHCTEMLYQLVSLGFILLFLK